MLEILGCRGRSCPMASIFSGGGGKKEDLHSLVHRREGGQMRAMETASQLMEAGKTAGPVGVGDHEAEMKQMWGRGRVRKA